MLEMLEIEPPHEVKGTVIWLHGLGDRGEDVEGIERARQMLLSLIAREVERGVPTGHILLAGFSQGAAVVLYTALRMAEPLAGVVDLSGYLPRPDALEGERQADPEQLVIRIDHGEQDPVVPFAAAKRTCNVLETIGYSVDFHAWPMQHSLCPPQARSLRSWIIDRLD